MQPIILIVSTETPRVGGTGTEITREYETHRAIVRATVGNSFPGWNRLAQPLEPS